jgi:hypothetical protein
LKGISMSTTLCSTFVKQVLLAKLEECQRRLAELAASLPDCLAEWAVAEESIRAGVLEVGHELLQGWSNAADAHASAPVCAGCQEVMGHKGYVTGPLVTTLGTLHVRRARFRCEYCGQECYPHDEQLRFCQHAVSWPLAQVMARLGAQLPFAQARQNLEADYGVRVCKHTLIAVCEDAGGAVLDEEDELRTKLQSLPVAEQAAALPDSALSPEKAYVFADGTMIHSAGEWHEIRVASVAAVDAQDQPLRTDHRARFLSCEDFGWQLLLLARGAGYHRAAKRVFLADGARWLWELAAMQFPDAVQILDWYHLSEHVHQIAALLYGEGTEAAKHFSDQRLTELWEGRSEQTLIELTQLRKQIRSASKREGLRQLINYLQNNQGRIDYPHYRQMGLRIGSGQVEGACKSLVGARCKQAGMRNWTRRGAEAVLRLRAALQTDNTMLSGPPAENRPPKHRHKTAAAP